METNINNNQEVKKEETKFYTGLNKEEFKKEAKKEFKNGKDEFIKEMKPEFTFKNVIALIFILFVGYKLIAYTKGDVYRVKNTEFTETEYHKAIKLKDLYNPAFEKSTWYGNSENGQYLVTFSGSTPGNNKIPHVSMSWTINENDKIEFVSIEANGEKLTETDFYLFTLALRDGETTTSAAKKLGTGEMVKDFADIFTGNNKQPNNPVEEKPSSTYEPKHPTEPVYSLTDDEFIDLVMGCKPYNTHNLTVGEMMQYLFNVKWEVDTDLETNVHFANITAEKNDIKYYIESRITTFDTIEIESFKVFKNDQHFPTDEFIKEIKK